MSPDPLHRTLSENQKVAEAWQEGLVNLVSSNTVKTNSYTSWSKEPGFNNEVWKSMKMKYEKYITWIGLSSFAVIGSTKIQLVK